jgi:hypothetical protein
MNAKVEKRLRRYANKRIRDKFKDYTSDLQSMGFWDRLYFAWVIVARRGYVKPK